MNPTQPRVRITPAGAGGKWWLIRCGACPATDVHHSLPDSHAGRSLDTPEVLP